MIGKLLAKKTIGEVGAIIDNIFTSKDEKLTHQEIFERIKQMPAAIQVDLNKQESLHRTLFVAGWRPFIGWVCGVALAYNFIVRDFLAWVLTNTTDNITMPPNLSMDSIMTILLGMLGLGAYRSYEKVKGVAK